MKRLLELVNDKVMEVAAKKYEIKVSEKEIDIELALIHSLMIYVYRSWLNEKERQKIRIQAHP